MYIMSFRDGGGLGHARGPIRSRPRRPRVMTMHDGVLADQ